MAGSFTYQITGENELFTFDFSLVLASGETISSATSNVQVMNGADSPGRNRPTLRARLMSHHQRHESGLPVADMEHIGSPWKITRQMRNTLGEIDEAFAVVPIVRALFVVTQGEFNGIADVAQAALFSNAELDAAGDFAVVNVEARNDTGYLHGISASVSSASMTVNRFS